MKPVSTKEKLNERIKELTCLHEISTIISQSNAVDNFILQKIIFAIQNALRYNYDAVIEIQVLNFNISTSSLNTAATVYQTSTIQIAKKNIGILRAHYPKEKYLESDFLEEEQKLLDIIANDIGLFIEKHQIFEKAELLTRMVEKLDRLNTLGEMTAGIAHELNTPLGNILGFAELINMNNTNSEITPDLSMIIDSAIYCREIVKKLMTLSSETPLQLEFQEIKPIVDFTLAFLKPNFLKKNIKSEVVFDDNSIRAKIDSVQITQVLLNLLLNAIYASAEKSVIRIIIKKDAKILFITIEDQGTGIPENIKQKIFDPFFTTKLPNEGYGLGLSLVNGIIKKHNGKIIVTNNIPSGAIFTIKLPTTLKK